MEWMIEGADMNTGEDVRLVVEANDSETAESMARGKGIMVSSTSAIGVAQVVAVAEQPRMKPKPTPKPKAKNAPIPTAEIAPEVTQPVEVAIEEPRKRNVPDYADIVKGHHFLKIMAMVTVAVGYISLLLAVVLMVWPLVELTGPIDKAAIASAGSAAEVPAGFGICMLIAASLIRMMASLALAIRDIARNSYKSLD